MLKTNLRRLTVTGIAVCALAVVGPACAMNAGGGPGAVPGATIAMNAGGGPGPLPAATITMNAGGGPG